ncbi:hypothetical protein [Nocardia paucivorans]|uniref:hypothetical protein n=1 Tax=Nocardia paucivorans TaxID=114259 RepID=UPI0002F61D59|nr:hypothetical protein [Nocardia paucivorans]
MREKFEELAKHPSLAEQPRSFTRSILLEVAAVMLTGPQPPERRCRPATGIAAAVAEKMPPRQRSRGAPVPKPNEYFRFDTTTDETREGESTKPTGDQEGLVMGVRDSKPATIPCAGGRWRGDHGSGRRTTNPVRPQPS